MTSIYHNINTSLSVLNSWGDQQSEFSWYYIKKAAGI